MLLNLSVSGFHVDYSTMNDTRLKEILLKQATIDPDSISVAFTDRGRDMKFIANLIDKKHLVFKPGNGYYEGSSFLASDMNTMIAYIEDSNNSSLIAKWGKLLKLESE